MIIKRQRPRLAAILLLGLVVTGGLGRSTAQPVAASPELVVAPVRPVTVPAQLVAAPVRPVTAPVQSVTAWPQPVTALGQPAPPSAAGIVLSIPRLAAPPAIDGDLADWRELAWHDGEWNVYRVRSAPWYDGGRINRLTRQRGETGSPDDDLAAKYFLAWDERYLYLGAEVRDNVNDVTSDPRPEPKRWYYKDAIAWFVEAPRDDVAAKFAEGNHGFAFVIDPAKPEHGAWWRHGEPGRTYVEEPLPKSAVTYAIRLNPWGRSAGDFILEARVDLAETAGRTSRTWTPPKEGDVYSLCIVHTDPDGGGYGGHLIIYGTGDDDGTWARAQLTSPQLPVERKPN